MGESYEAARRRKERALANLRELEFNRKRGQLLDATWVEKTWTGMMRTLSAAVLAAPARIHQRLPGLSRFDVRVIDEELRATLTTLADTGERGGLGNDAT